MRHTSRIAHRGIAVLALAAPLLLAAVAPDAGAFPVLHPAYTAGCQGVSTGTKIFSSSGKTVGGKYTFNNSNGRTHGWEGASASGGSSAIYAGAYYFVGPAPSGCMYASASLSNLQMTWRWTLSVNPYLAANCTGQEPSANATLQMINFGNVHDYMPPFYLFSTHLTATPFPYTAIAHCTGYGSNIVNPGWVGPIHVTIVSPRFSMPGLTAFDVYTSVYANATATATGGSSAVSKVTVRAHLESISCPRCP